MNAYRLATHGDSTSSSHPRLCPAALNNIFTRPGDDDTLHQRESPSPDNRVGDYIDSDDRDHQRVTSVRNGGTRGSLDGSLTILAGVGWHFRLGEAGAPPPARLC